MRTFDTYAAKVGERIIHTRDHMETTMVIWLIREAGADGTSRAAGPRIFAHTRPGGFGVSFDAYSLEAGFMTIRYAPEEAPHE